jgi:hypothetical protein
VVWGEVGAVFLSRPCLSCLSCLSHVVVVRAWVGVCPSLLPIPRLDSTHDPTTQPFIHPPPTPHTNQPSIATFGTREEALNAINTLNKSVLRDRPVALKFYSTNGGRGHRN